MWASRATASTAQRLFVVRADVTGSPRQRTIASTTEREALQAAARARLASAYQLWTPGLYDAPDRPL
jgi:hypothetical protein